jgi:hypothetical protein
MATEETTYTIGGAPFQLPEKPNVTGLAEESLWYFEGSLREGNEFLEQRAAILMNNRLSGIGHREEIAPLVSKMIDRLGERATSLAGAAAHLEAKEAELMAVATPSTLYEISCEREIRDWWRDLDGQAKSEAWAAIQADPTKYKHLTAAVLNSPIPAKVNSLEAQFVAENHRAARVKDRPDIVAFLEDGGAAHAWADRGFQFVKSFVMRFAEITNDQILEHFAKKDDKASLLALGFAPGAVVRSLQKFGTKKMTW